MATIQLPDEPGYGHGVQWIGDVDPGAVGAYQVWLDPTSGGLQIRNATNTGWDLAAGTTIAGPDDPDGSLGARVEATAAAPDTGGSVSASAGDAGVGGGVGAALTLVGGAGAVDGVARLRTIDPGGANTTGAAGDFLWPDGVTGLVLGPPIVRAAAGVPAGAPIAGELPIAVDTTAVTGGVYFWTGAAWVQAATI